MLPGNATEDASRQVFGNCLDMRVLHITRDGHAAAHWVESVWYEYWTPPAPEGEAA